MFTLNTLKNRPPQPQLRSSWMPQVVFLLITLLSPALSVGQTNVAKSNSEILLFNGSFESPSIIGCVSQTSPSGWGSTGDVHLLKEGTGCYVPTAPAGDQVVALEPGASINRVTNWQPGKYQVRFQAALDINPLVSFLVPPVMEVFVKVDGNLVGKFSIGNGLFDALTTGTFEVTSPNPTIEMSVSCCLPPPTNQAKAANIGHPYTVATLLDEVVLINAPLWSNSASWSLGVIPNTTHQVLIPTGVDLTLDQSATIETLEINGTLSVDQAKNIDLSTDYLLVKGQGALFQWGTAAQPYSGQGTITLTATNTTQDILTMGTKFLAARDAGVIEIHGAHHTSWTKLNATAPKSSTQISLVDPTDWQVGDSIVIASTDFDFLQAEARYITAISNQGKDITLNRPLEYMHFGELQYYNGGTEVLDNRAEVGLLSRNITIQGANPGPIGFGGHIIVTAQGKGYISGVKLYHMGQKGELGRYPMHWHHGMDASGQYIQNSTISRSFNRVVAVHRTNNALIADNVGFDHIGHGFFLEDATEKGNVFDHNLGLVTRAPQPGEEVQYHDRVEEDNFGHILKLPATFWITNPANTFTNNSAAGSEGSGFWMIAQDGIISGPNIPGFPSPKNEMLVGFNGNTGHSNPFSNFSIDGKVIIINTPERDFEDLGFAHYEPKINGQQGVPLVTNFTSYKCRDRSIWVRANRMIFDNCTMADNHKATFFAFNQKLQNSLIVGLSGNVGNPASVSEISVGRTIPRPMVSNIAHNLNHFFGHILYDGASELDNVHFAGFLGNPTVPNVIRERSYALSHSGAANKHPMNRSEGISFEPGMPTPAKMALFNASHFSNVFAGGLLDMDGSITGTANTRITPLVNYNSGGTNTPSAVRNNGYSVPPGSNEELLWNAGFTTNLNVGSIYLTALWPKNSTSPVYYTRYDGGLNMFNQPAYPTLGDNPAYGIVYQPSTFTNSGQLYFWQFHRLPENASIRLRFAQQDHRMISVFPFVPSDIKVQYQNGSPMVLANTLWELQSSNTEKYIIQDNMLYIHHKASLGGTDPRYGDAYSNFSPTVRLCTGTACNTNRNWTNGVVLADFELGNYQRALFKHVLTTPTTVYASAEDPTSCPGGNCDDYVSFDVIHDGNADGYSQYNIQMYDLPWTEYDQIKINITGMPVQVYLCDRTYGCTNLGKYTPNNGEVIVPIDGLSTDQRDGVYSLKLRFFESDITPNSTASVQINNIALEVGTTSQVSIQRQQPAAADELRVDAQQSSFFSIYPNPSNGAFTLSATDLTPHQPFWVSIFSQDGRTVFRKEYRSSNSLWDATYEQMGLNLRPGMYLVQVVQGDLRAQKNLVIIE